MKTKRMIFSLLLSAFLFVAFHDFVVQHFDSDTQLELAYVHGHNESICEVSTLHEIIHSMMLCTDNHSFITASSTPFSPYLLKTSQHVKKIQQNIYRPPIV
ncbi:MAG: hypothetical protein U9R50_10605 [Campylobacterota bacterium]|nr:hypothetical protein [Campylobacterota bacterium]